MSRTVGFPHDSRVVLSDRPSTEFIMVEFSLFPWLSQESAQAWVTRGNPYGGGDHVAVAYLPHLDLGWSLFVDPRALRFANSSAYNYIACT